MRTLTEPNPSFGSDFNWNVQGQPCGLGKSLPVERVAMCQTKTCSLIAPLDCNSKFSQVNPRQQLNERYVKV
jgi:hypothetical protein